jgi:hypothetical protein
MTAEMIELAAELCAAVLGVQLTAVALVWVMDFADWMDGRTTEG